jgi:hypothetical protein
MTISQTPPNAPKSLCGCANCAPFAPRRKFLSGSIAALALAGGGLNLLSGRPAAAQTTLEPDEALKELFDGNARFVAQELTAFNDDLHILKDNTIAKQEPFAAVLSCADSRVPVELLSTKASAMSSSRGSQAISVRRRSLRASNTAPARWELGRSSCLAIPAAGR